MKNREEHLDRRWTALILLCVAQFVVVLDASIVNVALPSIGKGLHFSEQNLPWVVNAYVIAFGGFLLLGGRAADLLGRRRVFMAGLMVVAVASLLAGFAANQGELIAARAAQGLGAAIISPAALSIVTNLFRDGAERNKALGAWGAAKIVGLLSASVALIAAFIVLELRSRAPLIPFRIFRSRTLTGSNVVGVLLGASLFSMFFFISLYMQQVLGYSPIHAGLSYLPLALTIIFAAGVGGQFVTRFGFKPILAAGMAFVAVGLLWFSRVSVGGGSSLAKALPDGFQSAFLGGAVLPGLGFLAALILIRSRDSRAHVEMANAEAAPAQA